MENCPRVASLVLYEPTLWGMLAAECPDDPATREIGRLRDETNRLIDAGALEPAAERFVDYWAGPGVWASTAEERRGAMIRSMHALRSGWNAAFAERPKPAALGSLEMPWLLLTGSRTAPPARRVVQMLRDAVPRIQIIGLEGLGHMGPISHAAVVNDHIAKFLESVL